MSLGLVVLEEKLFMWMPMQMPQRDNIMSADLSVIKTDKFNAFEVTRDLLISKIAK